MAEHSTESAVQFQNNEMMMMMIAGKYPKKKSDLQAGTPRVKQLNVPNSKFN